MTSIYSILANNYAAVGSSVNYSKTKYVAVNAADYQGTWTGTFNTNQKFTVQISNVQGFKATVKYQSGDTVNYQQVLIKDGQFRFGDSKFVLQSNGQALVATAITDPETGNVSVEQGYGSRS
ncbi:MAG TPA: hypothetical protein VHZ56_08645 [Devosia sp.]|nr:hypothetical protein [Devosia sp.]